MRKALGPNGFFERRGSTGVLLIHGLTGTPAEMRPFARHLSKSGLTVACPQLGGHCSSVEDLKKSSWQDWYAPVEAAFEALCQECDTVYVGGLSMGALMAMMLASRHAKHEQLAGVILLSPTFFYDGWNMPKWYAKAALTMVVYSPLQHIVSWEEKSPYGIKDERVRARVTSILANRDAKTADKIGHFKTPASVIRESKRLIAAAKKVLTRITSRTLIVHSTEDDMASIKNAHYVMAKIGARDVQTYFVDDCYHVLTLDKQKEEIANKVAQFCKTAATYVVPAPAERMTANVVRL